MNKFYAFLAGSGIVLGAIYMLNLFRNVFLNDLKPHNANLADINLRESCAVIPLVIVVIWLGIYPKPILDKINLSVQNLVAFMAKKAVLEENREFLRSINAGLVDLVDLGDSLQNSNDSAQDSGDLSDLSQDSFDSPQYLQDSSISNDSARIINGEVQL